jgi:hypothetical protein
MKKRAISLLSGGLDSVLATRIVMEAGIEVTALHFVSPFCNCSKDGCGARASKAGTELGVEVIIMEKGLDYVKLVENPKFGYGKHMNPCIDCRIYMLKKAKEVMIERDAGFVVTGEVLGQRPMSQRRHVMRLIEKESGLEGLILRPLSARLLPETLPEKEGIVPREMLLAIAGRGRKVQFEYARKFDLHEFGCPAGGCLLTDPNFSKRVRDLFTYKKDYNMLDVALLRIGRHIRVNGSAKLIVGRNEEESRRLEAIHRPPYVLISPLDFRGPVALLCGEICEDTLRIGASILAHYGKYLSSRVRVRVKKGTSSIRVFERVDLDVERYIL